MNALLTWLRVKLMFATVVKCRGWIARYKLWRYERTLSPKNREYAQNLRKQLGQALTPDARAAILTREARRLSEDQMRVTERLDRLQKT